MKKEEEEQQLVNIIARIDKDLKKEFISRAKEYDTDASKLIRQFVGRWLKSHPPKSEK